MLCRCTPDRLHYSDENCSIRGPLDIVGEKWTLLVLREAFYGVRRFDDFHRALGCARNLLSERLRTLVEEGVLPARPTTSPASRSPVRVPAHREGARALPRARRANAVGRSLDRRRRRSAGRGPPPRMRRHRERRVELQRRPPTPVGSRHRGDPGPRCQTRRVSTARVRPSPSPTLAGAVLLLVLLSVPDFEDTFRCRRPEDWPTVSRRSESFCLTGRFNSYSAR